MKKGIYQNKNLDIINDDEMDESEEMDDV